MRRVKRSESTEIRWELGVVGEELMRTGVVYALICKKKDDKAERDRKWQLGGGRERCGNADAAPWLK